MGRAWAANRCLAWFFRVSKEVKYVPLGPRLGRAWAHALVFPRLLLHQKRFDVHLKLHEDWDFLLNVLEDAELRFIDMVGPRVHNDDPKLLKRLGSQNHGALAMDMIHVYRRWPGKSQEIKLKR